MNAAISMIVSWVLFLVSVPFLVAAAVLALLAIILGTIGVVAVALALG